MVEQGIMVEVGGWKMAMASSSVATSSLALQARPSDYRRYPPPLTTYEEVVASPKLFRETLEKLHIAMGTKFMIPTVGGRDLDLHRLFVEVTSRGGIAKILQERKWKDVIGIFSFPSSATNASFVLRKYYLSLLLHYEQIYFFRAEGWTPETTDALQNSSSKDIPLPQELAEPVGSSLAASPQAQRAESANLLREASPAPSMGSEVLGVIDGKFESGYLVTVKIGSEEFKGVLYQATLDPDHQDIRNQSSQQRQRVSVNIHQSSAALGVVRRRRRKKSEIKKRDPAHPKPNRSGYNFFFAEQHARLKPLYPGRDREISRMIGDSWNKLKESEKAVYQEKAVRDKERYRIEMEGYRERVRTGQIISSAVPIQQQHLQPHISTDKKFESKGASTSYSELKTGQAIGGIAVQQQTLGPDLNMMDVDKKVQMEDAPHTPENETRPSESEQRNLENHQIAEKDAGIEISTRAEIDLGNAPEEILANEEATQMRKGADMDGDEDMEYHGDIALEIDKE